MIGIGLDLCEVARMEKILVSGNGFAERYFTAAEQAYLQQRGQMAAQSMAAIFAAKEALAKALGVGIGNLALQEAEVLHHPNGSPYYALAGAVKEQLTALGATRALLSITHEAGMAAAVAIIE